MERWMVPWPGMEVEGAKGELDILWWGGKRGDVDGGRVYRGRGMGMVVGEQLYCVGTSNHIL